MATSNEVFEAVKGLLIKHYDFSESDIDMNTQIYDLFSERNISGTDIQDKFFNFMVEHKEEIQEISGIRLASDYKIRSELNSYDKSIYYICDLLYDGRL